MNRMAESRARSRLHTPVKRSLRSKVFVILLPLALLALGISAVVLRAPRVPTPALRSRTQGVIFTLLLVGLFQETWAILTSLWMRESQIGQLSVGKVVLPSSRHLRASAALAYCYLVVLATNYAIFCMHIPTSHLDPLLGRPVCTLRYASWLSTVPFTMWITGGLMMEHPMRMLTKPILLTVIYLILAFILQFFSMAWRLPLIVLTFALFAWASIAQCRWLQREQPLASALVLFEIGAFTMYSVVFLCGQANIISPVAECCAYTLFDTAVKLVHSLVVITMRWTTEIWSFHAALCDHVDLLVETRGLVRSHADLFVHCRRSQEGLLVIGSHPFLEHGVGKPLVGKLLEEICFAQEDRERLRNYQDNQVVGHDVDVLLERMSNSAWGRQVSVSRDQHEVPRALQMNITFRGLPSNKMAVKVLINAGELVKSSKPGTVVVGFVFDYSIQQQDELDLETCDSDLDPF